ncbi:MULTISPECIES: TrmB family transcriptional regulator [unclassified Actinomyces]|uniref:TrmB family transcriptional regulator n=1 Tax=unclassified Actinomyces TaxID=2609248 RepID=UPI0013A6AA11|nr:MULTISPECIES: TrmB family transcriptional regulator [unclassified Actinomyces]MBW3068669.1 TrmB family transcriptional regulator [Actinomyces sp. 594]NDR53589.1 TrmB family transcriptional regulator [Actinomyces sp. 565]
MVSVAEQLQALGMTDWESRAYLALLEEAPATGYAIAKRAGIARSKIYEVLASLAADDYVQVSRGNPQMYAPLPPRELISRLRSRFNDSLDAAEASLSAFAADAVHDGAIWDLQGRAAIIERANRLIAAAQHRILAELWAQDVPALEDSLRRAADRDVEIIIVGYGEIDLDCATVHPHPATDTVTAGLGGRWVVVSIDDRELVAGNVSAGAHSRAAWTSHPGLVVPVTELVRHDLYKLEMLARHGDVLERSFGPGLQVLRDKYAPLN